MSKSEPLQCPPETRVLCVLPPSHCSSPAVLSLPAVKATVTSWAELNRKHSFFTGPLSLCLGCQLLLFCVAKSLVSFLLQCLLLITVLNLGSWCHFTLALFFLILCNCHIFYIITLFCLAALSTCDHHHPSALKCCKLHENSSTTPTVPHFCIPRA